MLVLAIHWNILAFLLWFSRLWMLFVRLWLRFPEFYLGVLRSYMRCVRFHLVILSYFRFYFRFERGFLWFTYFSHFFLIRQIFSSLHSFGCSLWRMGRCVHLWRPSPSRTLGCCYFWCLRWNFSGISYGSFRDIGRCFYLNTNYFNRYCWYGAYGTVQLLW